MMKSMATVLDMIPINLYLHERYCSQWYEYGLHHWSTFKWWISFVVVSNISRKRNACQHLLYWCENISYNWGDIPVVAGDSDQSNSAYEFIIKFESKTNRYSISGYNILVSLPLIFWATSPLIHHWENDKVVGQNMTTTSINFIHYRKRLINQATAILQLKHANFHDKHAEILCLNLIESLFMKCTNACIA